MILPPKKIKPIRLKSVNEKSRIIYTEDNGQLIVCVIDIDGRCGEIENGHSLSALHPQQGH